MAVGAVGGRGFCRAASADERLGRSLALPLRGKYLVGIGGGWGGRPPHRVFWRGGGGGGPSGGIRRWSGGWHWGRWRRRSGAAGSRVAIVGFRFDCAGRCSGGSARGAAGGVAASRRQASLHRTDTRAASPFSWHRRLAGV